MKPGKNIWKSTRFRATLSIVLLGVLFAFILNNIAPSVGLLIRLFKAISPFVTGLAIAFVLNPLVRFFEEKVYKKVKGKRGLSIATVFVLVLAAIWFVVSQLLPLIVMDLTELIFVLPLQLSKLGDYIASGGSAAQLNVESIASGMNTVETVILPFATSTLKIFTSALGFLGYLWSGFVQSLMSTAVAMIVLLGKEKMGRQFKSLLCAFSPPEKADTVLKTVSLANRVFYIYIQGTMINAVVTGTMTFIFLLVANLFTPVPYALVIGIIMIFASVIPSFGQMLGGMISTILVLTFNPAGALALAIFILVWEVVDINFVAPHFKVSKLKIPVWLVLLVTIGSGSLFGLVGVVFCVPITAILYTLLAEEIHRRQNMQNAAEETP